VSSDKEEKPRKTSKGDRPGSGERKKEVEAEKCGKGEHQEKSGRKESVKSEGEKSKRKAEHHVEKSDGEKSKRKAEHHADTPHKKYKEVRLLRLFVKLTIPESYTSYSTVNDESEENFIVFLKTISIGSVSLM
jgi:hypothetical protein